MRSYSQLMAAGGGKAGFLMGVTLGTLTMPQGLPHIHALFKKTEDMNLGGDGEIRMDLGGVRQGIGQQIHCMHL